MCLAILFLHLYQALDFIFGPELLIRWIIVNALLTAGRIALVLATGAIFLKKNTSVFLREIFFPRFYIQRSARLQLWRRSRGPGEVRFLLQLAEFRHRTNLQLGVLVRRRKKVTFCFVNNLNVLSMFWGIGRVVFSLLVYGPQVRRPTYSQTVKKGFLNVVYLKKSCRSHSTPSAGQIWETPSPNCSRENQWRKTN